MKLCLRPWQGAMAFKNRISFKPMIFKNFYVKSHCQWYQRTVWKFHDFSTSQILREIIFWDSRSAKSTILTHLVSLNFEFTDFCTFWRLEFTRIQSPKDGKKANSVLLDSRKLISRKIWAQKISENSTLCVVLCTCRPP